MNPLIVASSLCMFTGLAIMAGSLYAYARLKLDGAICFWFSIGGAAIINHGIVFLQQMLTGLK